jgi:hypothetical protein
MTATNHVIAGAIIGAIIPIPAIAIPLAFLSHFVLDALPHFDNHVEHNSRYFLYYLSIDCGLAASVLLSLMILQPSSWIAMVVCGIAAASPDLMWFPLWVKEMQGEKPKPMGAIRRFHARIQWGAEPWGIIFEVPWFFGAVAVLFVVTTL